MKLVKFNSLRTFYTHTINQVLLIIRARGISTHDIIISSTVNLMG